MLGNDPLIEPWYRRRWVWVTALVVAFLGFSYWYDVATVSPTVSENGAGSTGNGTTTVPGRDESEPPGAAPTQDSASSGQSTATPTVTVTEQSAFAITRASAGTCSADRPEGWSNLIAVEGNQGADLASNDKTMYAGYAVKPINTQLAPYAGVQPPPLNDPQLYSEDPAAVTLAHAQLFAAGLGGRGDLAFSGDVNEAIGDYQIRSVSGSTHRGVVFYHRSGFPGDGVSYSYALPMRFALTANDRWEQFGLLVARVAASIQCTATLIAREPSGPDLGGSDSTSTDDRNGSDAGYNPELGTEEVHDPDTGQNYVVSPSTNWSETGPQGPGYYAGKGGGDYVHLQPGRSD